VEITEKNFSKYFFPVNEHAPQKGQVMARWRATADFVDGWVKRNVIELLCTSKAGAQTAARVMKKIVMATDKDGIRVLREMAQDLVDGKTLDEVAEKPYKFTIEQFYWTQKEHVPEDPHWDIISIVDVRGVDSKIDWNDKAESANV
jgi:hypothetical protein